MLTFKRVLQIGQTFNAVRGFMAFCLAVPFAVIWATGILEGLSWTAIMAWSAFALACGAVFAHFVLEVIEKVSPYFKARPQFKLLKVINDVHYLSNVEVDGQVILLVENSGDTDLANCLVKVDGQYATEEAYGHPNPRAIRTEAQQGQDRTGPFNLRSGEKKRLPLCHYRHTKGDTFARIFVYFEDDDKNDFDPEELGYMHVGLYSEGLPQHVKLKFERSEKDGLVTCLLIEEKIK
jgi:hypothetical protein